MVIFSFRNHTYITLSSMHLDWIIVCPLGHRYKRICQVLYWINDIRLCISQHLSNAHAVFCGCVYSRILLQVLSLMSSLQTLYWRIILWYNGQISVIFWSRKALITKWFSLVKIARFFILRQWSLWLYFISLAPTNCFCVYLKCITRLQWGKHTVA